MIINVHCICKHNIGDKVSSPCLYFPIDAIELWRDQLTEQHANQKIILGGGAVLGKEIRADIVWGAGMSDRTTNTPTPPEWLKKSKLVGIRDYVDGWRWVPCVSCMSDVFDKKRPEPIHDKIIYMNYNRPSISDYSVPTMANNANSFEDAIKFLSSGKKVITNSYHGIYWAKLLNKEVEIVDGYSSKLFQFKPNMTLKECRKANLDFWNDVKKELMLK